MNNLATPLPPLFHWHRDIKQIEAIGKFFCLILPFILEKEFMVWGKPIQEKFTILCKYIYPWRILK